MREGPPWDGRLLSEPDDKELLMSRLNGLTTSSVHINTHRVTRIRSGRPVNAGGLVTHSVYEHDNHGSFDDGSDL